jgi:hypothetical protein
VKRRVLASTLAVTCCLTSIGWAQTEIPTPTLTSQEASLASNFNRGRQPVSDDAKKALKKQVLQHISKLTQAKEMLAYPQLRRNVELLLAEPKQPAEARATVVEAVILGAGTIARDNKYSQAARVNCLAMLAELDEKTDNSRDQTPPLPSKGAFLTLKALAADPKTPPHLRAIALHGLERHVRVYWISTLWDDALRTEIQKIATDILAENPKTVLDQQSHAWLTRRAYDILGVIKTPVALDIALEQLGEPTEFPSVRLSALAYLSELDWPALPADKHSKYMISLTHFLRSQLVDWYEYQEDIIKRDTNAQAGGMGGGMGMGGMGMEGGMGMGMGGEEGGYGGYGGDMGGMGMEGGEGGYGGGMMGGRGMGGMGGGMMGGNKPKPIETQDWRTRGSRRLLNQVSQQVHIALNGMPLTDSSTPLVAKPLTAIEGNAEIAAQATELLTLLDELQTQVNDATKIKTINTLLTGAKIPIENIMEFAIELPGFVERYPDLADDEEKLDEVPEAPVIEDEDMEEPAEDAGEAAPAEGDGEAADAGDGR